MSLLIWGSVLLGLQFAHPFHISVCDVLHNPRTNRVELVQRIFLDDLEQALRSYTKDPHLDIMKPESSMVFDSLLRSYYKEKVTLWIDDRPKELIYLGHERKEDSMWSYLETRSRIRKAPKRIIMRNVVLFETFNDQQNLIKIRIVDSDRSLMLHKDQPQKEATF